MANQTSSLCSSPMFCNPEDKVAYKIFKERSSFGHVRRLAIYFGRRTDGLLNVCVSFKLISFFPILYKCSIAGLDNNTVCVVQTRLLRWEGVFTMRDKLTNCCCLTKYNTIHASCHAPIYVGLPTAANDKPRLVFWAGCLKGGIFPGKYCK